MIEPSKFYRLLLAKSFDFFVGVPDSLLKSFCAYVNDKSSREQHIIAANEGNAIAIAAGYFMAKRKVPVVYMQNSGLGNTINPLISLAGSEVYSIPMILMIGWRGEPGIRDEPQHQKQGSVTEEQLKILDIDYYIMDSDTNIEELVENVSLAINRKSSPVAILVKKNSFSSYKPKKLQNKTNAITREKAIDQIVSLSADDDILISTTGKSSRELYEIRGKKSDVQKDFLTVGSMGHASSIALGVSIVKRDRKIICLDGDGALLMHMGALPIIGSISPSNFLHIILNNFSHESVGGQATVASIMDFQKLSEASNYKNYRKAKNIKELDRAWHKINYLDGPSMLEIIIESSSREDLGRPTSSPIKNKESFMQFLKNV